MRRRKSDTSLRTEKLKANLIHFSITLAFFFLFVIFLSSLKFDKVSEDVVLRANFISDTKNDVTRKERRMIEKEQPLLSSIRLDGSFVNATGENGLPVFLYSAVRAFEMGSKLWRELNKTASTPHGLGSYGLTQANQSEICPETISRLGPAHLVELPCGLKVGSQVTIVGTPKKAWPKFEKGEYTMVSEFTVELEGLRAVDGEDPPRIFHFNPRLKGDLSGEPVIEMNTCYRWQWGIGVKCDGYKSNYSHDETVDGQVKCERWASDEPMVSRWLRKQIKGTQTEDEWTFPFKEGKLFVLDIRAGLEGYHVSVDGKHLASFHHHLGFELDDATGLSIEGDIDVHSIHVAPLPMSHKNNDPESLLELSSNWTRRPLLDGYTEMFIGIISVGNHFAERMAIRKSWMQHTLIKSSEVVVRFFIAMHAKKEVNLVVKKEADFYKDIVIVPYMDDYNLVVLKTIAIIDYGVNVVNAKYIMKGDDDTFVRIDSIMDIIKSVPQTESLYLGKINKGSAVMRSGKWAVTYEEWAGDYYPWYADGPGYIVTSDIAKFILSLFKDHKLKLFRMEDVSMGMWVEQFNSTKKEVEYIHSKKFSQSGCVEDYIISHYQSPKQMICLWNKLQKQVRPQCCNF